jgi:hypothetical protein
LFTRLSTRSGLCLRILLFSWKPIFSNRIFLGWTSSASRPRDLQQIFLSLDITLLVRIFRCFDMNRRKDHFRRFSFLLFLGIYRSPVRQSSPCVHVLLCKKPVGLS